MNYPKLKNRILFSNETDESDEIDEEGLNENNNRDRGRGSRNGRGIDYNYIIIRRIRK